MPRSTLLLTILFSFLPASFTKAELPKEQIAALKQKLAMLLQKKHELGVHEYIQELAELADSDAARLIFPAALRIDSKDNYALAVETLSKTRDAATLALLDNMLLGKRAKKTDLRSKRLIVDAIAARDDDESFARLVKLAEDRKLHHLLRLAAIRGLVGHKRKEAVPVLIGLVEATDKSPDRIWLDSRDGLRRLTGRDFSNVRDWKNYWATAKDTLDPTRVNELPPDSKTVVGKGVLFFGQALHSHNLIFVVDISSSMLKYDPRDEFKGRNPERDLQRLYLAQKQLVKTIKTLPKSARFNIIAYSDTVIPWKRSLQKMSSSSASSAARFISSFKPTGFTHTDDALKIAFTDPNVDTIVLLSDGNPSKKRSTSSLEIIEKTLAWLDQANASRRIRIDTFGITSPGRWPATIPDFTGQPPPPPTETEVASFTDFLTQIAEKTGGVFRPLQ